MNEELKVIITAEIDKLKTELQKGQKEVKGFGEKSKTSFKDFNDGVQKAGNVAKKSLAVAATAIIGAATALLALTASTAEYRQNQAKLSAAFETAGASAETAKNTYNDLYRVLGDDGQAVEAANHLAQLTTNEKELAEWTNICQGVYATFGDSLPIEGLTEAANETAKVGTVTGSLADALNWAGINEDAFNEKLAACNTEAEREKLIRETLNGLYSEASANYETAAANTLAQNEAQAKLNEKMAALGEAMAPINTALTEFAAKLMDELMPIIEEFMKNHGAQLEETLNNIAEAIGNVLSWIIDNWDLISTIAVIITAIAVAIGVFSTAMSIANAVMYASPITWIIMAIVAAIAALVAIIVLVIKYWDEIVAAVKAGINWIVEMFNKVVNFVKENWQGLLLLLVNPFAGAFKLIYDNCEGFRNLVDNVVAQIKEFFANLWASIQQIFANVGSWFSEKFTAAVNGVKKAFSKVGDFFRGIWNDIKSIFSNVGSAIANAITGTVKSAINAVLGTAVKIINGFISAINFAIDVINAIPGVSIGRLSSLSVPQLAKGGIATGDTLAHIGEDGYREAVLPLDRNTEWMDELAARLGERMGGSAPIVLQVDGKTFAQTAISTINQNTRQTGRLALNIV